MVVTKDTVTRVFVPVLSGHGCEEKRFYLDGCYEKRCNTGGCGERRYYHVVVTIDAVTRLGATRAQVRPCYRLMFNI